MTKTIEQTVNEVAEAAKGAAMDAATKAAANVAEAAASSGTTQASVGAAYRSSGADVTSDIGQAEAYIVNLKGVVEDAISLRKSFDSIAIQMAQNAANEANRRQSLATGHDNRINAFQEGEVARTVRHSDLAIDRHWNVDEVAALVAKTPVFQDAIAGAVAAAVAAVVSKEK